MLNTLARHPYTVVAALLCAALLGAPYYDQCYAAYSAYSARTQAQALAITQRH